MRSALGPTFLAYVASKAAVFVLPLWLSNTLSLGDYGRWEFCLSAAMVAALAAGLGAPGAVPYFLLHRGRPAFARTFESLAALFALAAPLSAAAHYSGLLGLRTYLIVALAAILVSQSLLAWLFRSTERPASSALMDGGVYVFLLLVLAAFAALAGPRAGLGPLGAAVGLYGAVLAAYALRRVGFPRFDRRFRTRIAAIARFGVPTLGASVLFTLFLMAPRFALEAGGDTPAVGVYAFHARIAAIGMILFQVNMVARFRANYQLEREGADRMLSRQLAFFFVVGLGVFAALPALLAPISELARAMTGEERRAFFWLSLQSALWFTCAHMEFVCYREKKAGAFALALAAALALFWIAAAPATGVAPLGELARAHTAAFALVLFAQAAMLRSALGFPVRLIALVAGLGAASLALERALF